MKTRQPKTYECRSCGKNIGSLIDVITTGGGYATTKGGTVQISLCNQHPQSMFATCEICEAKNRDNELSLSKILKAKMAVGDLTSEEWGLWEHLPAHLTS